MSRLGLSYTTLKCAEGMRSHEDLRQRDGDEVGLDMLTLSCGDHRGECS